MTLTRPFAVRSSEVHVDQECFIKASRVVYGMHCENTDDNAPVWRDTAGAADDDATDADGSPPLICDQYCIDMMECHEGGISTFDSRRMCAAFYHGPKCTTDADCNGGLDPNADCQYGICWSPGGHENEVNGVVTPTCFMGTPEQVGEVMLPVETATYETEVNTETGAHHVMYTDRYVGNTLLTVTYGGTPIPQSPVTLFVVPGAVDPANWYLFGSGVFKAAVGQVAQFALHARDAFNNTVPVETAVVSGYLDGPRLIELEMEAIGGNYVATYRSEVAGEYPMHLLFAGGITRVVNVELYCGDTSPEHTAFDRTQMPHSLTAGQLANFSVFTKDQFGNSRSLGGDLLNASMRSPAGVYVPVQTYDLGTGEYVVSYGATLAVEYNIGVSFGGIVLDLVTGTVVPCPAFVGPARLFGGDFFDCPGLPGFSPIGVNIVPDVTVDGQISGLTDGIAGEMSSFTIQGVDQYGNRAQYDPFSMADGFGARFYKASAPRTCENWDPMLYTCAQPATNEVKCPVQADASNDGDAPTYPHRVMQRCTGAATPRPATCGTGTDSNGDACAVMFAPNTAACSDSTSTTEDACTAAGETWNPGNPIGCQFTCTPVTDDCTCLFRQAYTPTCDLSPVTDQVDFLDADDGVFCANAVTDDEIRRCDAETGAMCPTGCDLAGGGPEDPRCVFVNPLELPTGRCELTAKPDCTAALAVDFDGAACRERKCAYDSNSNAVASEGSLLDDEDLQLSITNNLDNSFTVHYRNSAARQHLVEVEYPAGESGSWSDRDTASLTSDSPKRFQVVAASPTGATSTTHSPTYVQPEPEPEDPPEQPGGHRWDTYAHEPRPHSDRGGLTDGELANTFGVGEQQHFIIRSRDIMENVVYEGGADVRVSARLTDAGDRFDAPISRFHVLDEDSGIYSGNYSMTTAGNFSIFMSVNDVALAGSPFQVQVTPGPADQYMTTARGFGISGGYSGVSVKFELISHDQYGNLVPADPLIEYSVALSAGCRALQSGCGESSPDLHPGVTVDNQLSLTERRTLEGNINTIGSPGLEIPVTNFIDGLTTDEVGVTAEVEYTIGTLEEPITGFFNVKVYWCEVWGNPTTQCNWDGAPTLNSDGSPYQCTPCARTYDVAVYNTQFLFPNVTLPADANASYAYGDGLLGTVAGVETMITVDLNNEYGVPQPIGVDTGDEVVAVLQGGSPFTTVVADIQGVCCDDHEMVREETNGLYENCTEARSFLARAGLDCSSDLGMRSPFRFLRDPCPAACGECVPNCDSKVLVFYNPLVSGTYDLSIRVNLVEMGGLQPITVLPAAISFQWSSVRVNSPFILAGESLTATLMTKDQYNNSKPYTDEETIVTARVVSSDGDTSVVMETENHNDGLTTLTVVPTIANAYFVKVYFSGVLAVEAPARTRCGHVAATAACVIPGDPAANIDLTAIGRSSFSCVPETIGGEFMCVITPVDSFGNVHEGPDASCGRAGCFSCLAYNENDPSTRLSYAIAEYNNAEQNGEYLVTMELQMAGSYRILCYLTERGHDLNHAGWADEDSQCDPWPSCTSRGDTAPLSAAPLPIEITPGPINSGQTLVTGEGLSRAVAGEEQVITVTTRDEFGNEVVTGNAVFSGSMRGPVMVQIAFARIEGGSYSATYTATASGIYTVSIMRGGGEPVADSPWSDGLTVAPAVVEAPMCIFIDNLCPPPTEAIQTVHDICARTDLPSRPTVAMAGTNFSYSVVSRDQFTNVLVNGGDFILATAQRESSFRLIEGITTDNVDGTYTIQFNIEQTGLYTLRTVVSALDIGDSPFALTVTPAVVVAAMSSLSGDGLLYAVAGEPAPVTITAVDRFDNPSSNLGNLILELKVSRSGVGTRDVHLYCPSQCTLDGVGVFHMPYTTLFQTSNNEISTALLEITLGGQHFGSDDSVDSEFSSPKIPVVHPNLPVASESGVERQPAGTARTAITLAGNTETFVVTPEDEYGNAIDWSCGLDLTADDWSCDGRGWLGSHVEAGVAPIMGTGMDETRNSMIDVTCRQLITEGPITRELMCNSATLTHGTGDNTYTVSAQATVAGQYDIVVKIGGAEVTNILTGDNSPDGFLVVPSAIEPTNCIVAEENSQGLIGGIQQGVAQFSLTVRDQYGNQINPLAFAGASALATFPSFARAVLLATLFVCLLQRADGLCCTRQRCDETC